MSVEWPTVRLSDLVSIKHGFAFKGEFFSDLPTTDILVTPGNFAIGGGFKSDKLKYYSGPVPEDYILKPNDLLVTMTDLSKQADTLGFSALVPANPTQRFLHNQRVGFIGFKSVELDKFYLYFLLHSKDYRHHVVSSATGSTVKHTSPSKIASFEFKLPPIATQVEIGRTLKLFEDKIQLNQQINQTLEQMAQAIFKSWFVDFEPVKAKIAELEAGGSEDDALLAAMQVISGKDPQQLTQLQTENPEHYTTLRATAALFPAAMQESELGEIPAGWGVATISEFGDVVCGKTPSKQRTEYYGSEVPFIKIPDMHGNVFVTKANEYLSSEGAASQPKKNIPKGSICVSCIATVGLVVIAVENSHTNQQINSIVPEKEAYTPYLYFQMKSLNQHLHDLASGGSATLNLNTGHFSKIQIIKPADAILNLYQNYAAPLLDAIHKSSNESNTLAELRDTLLPKLLSGELAIADAE